MLTRRCTERRPADCRQVRSHRAGHPGRTDVDDRELCADAVGTKLLVCRLRVHLTVNHQRPMRRDENGPEAWRWHPARAGELAGLPCRAERQPDGSSGTGCSGLGLPECGAPLRPVPASSVSGMSGSGSDSSFSLGRAASSAGSQGSSAPLPACWSGMSLGVGSGPGASGRGSLTALSLPRRAGTARGYPGGWKRCPVFVAMSSILRAPCHSGRAARGPFGGPRRARVGAATRT